MRRVAFFDVSVKCRFNSIITQNFNAYGAADFFSQTDNLIRVPFSGGVVGVYQAKFIRYFCDDAALYTFVTLN